uniref:Capsid protein n=1 Tax=Apple virus C TaxID=2709747 RepID=A0A6C0X1C0_9VIRU|nr:MAG: capsid protein [Apple virus C]
MAVFLRIRFVPLDDLDYVVKLIHGVSLIKSPKTACSVLSRSYDLKGLETARVSVPTEKVGQNRRFRDRCSAKPPVIDSGFVSSIRLCGVQTDVQSLQYREVSHTTMNNSAKTKPGRAKSAKSKKQASQNRGQNKSVSAPVSKGVVTRVPKPQSRGFPNGDILVSHRELISDISGSVDFDARLFRINPGVIDIFPWLSQLATAYESYVFERLEFQYETSSNTISTGKVIVAIDYDPTDNPPISKKQVMSYRGSVSSPTWSSCTHMSLPEDLRKRKTYFVRRGTGGNSAVTDVGNLFVCTSGQTDTSVVGELYVRYTIRLMTPQLNDLSVLNAIYARATGNTNATMFDNIVGTLELVTTNLSNQDARITLDREWQGYVSFSFLGTGIDVSNLEVIIAGDSPPGCVINAISLDGSATGATGLYTYTGVAGGIIAVTVPNSTLTRGNAYFGQADV